MSYATLLSNYAVGVKQLKGELAQDEAKLQVRLECWLIVLANVDICCLWYLNS